MKRSDMQALTPAELLALLKAAKARSERDWCLLLLIYKHGLRVSEGCNLRLDDLNLKAGEITIHRLKGSRKTVQPLLPHKGQPLLDEPKAIRAWLKNRKSDGSPYLVLSRKGGRLSRFQVFRIYQSCAKAAGLPPAKRHVHALKHTLASHLIAANVNLAIVRQTLGHASISSTMRYVSTTDTQAAKATHAALMELF